MDLVAVIARHSQAAISQSSSRMAEAKPVKASREFFGGSASDIQRVLSDLVESVNFVQYHEKNGERLNKAAIEKQGALMRALYELFPKLSYSQGKMKAALLAIAASKGFFGDDYSTRRSWANVSAKRVRTMARHFRQALGKAKASSHSWVHKVVPKELLRAEARPASMC